MTIPRPRLRWPARLAVLLLTLSSTAVGSMIAAPAAHATCAAPPVTGRWVDSNPQGPTTDPISMVKFDVGGCDDVRYCTTDGCTTPTGLKYSMRAWDRWYACYGTDPCFLGSSKVDIQSDGWVHARFTDTNWVCDVWARQEYYIVAPVLHVRSTTTFKSGGLAPTHSDDWLVPG